MTFTVLACNNAGILAVLPLLVKDKACQARVTGAKITDRPATAGHGALLRKKGSASVEIAVRSLTICLPDGSA